MYQSFGGVCCGAAASRRAVMLPKGYFFCQRLSVGKYWRSCSRYSSAVRFRPVFLLNSSRNCTQTSIISSIVQSCVKWPSACQYLP